MTRSRWSVASTLLVAAVLFGLLIGGNAGGFAPRATAQSISFPLPNYSPGSNGGGGVADVQNFAQWGMISTNSVAVGAGSMTVTPCYFPLGGSSQSPQNWFPLAIGVQVKVLDGTSAETVYVTAVSAPALSFGSASPGWTCGFSATFANAHSAAVKIQSGDFGLGEAAAYFNANSTNQGYIVTTPNWGGTPSTITGITSANAIALFAGRAGVLDISGGAPTLYTLQPTTLTALAVPTTSNNLTCTAVAGLVCQSATVGGTWPNSAEVAGDIYVDALGGWSVASVTHTLTPSATGTNVLQFNSPAASAGAVGWLPWGGLTYNSASYVLPVTASNCTLSTQFTGYPVCAIGATATMLGPVVTTSLIPQAASIAAAYNPVVQSHNAFGLRQVSSYRGFQQNYGPFAACPALTAGQLCVVGTVQLPTGLLQNLGIGATLRFSFDVINTPSTSGTAQGIDVEIGDITDFTTGTPTIICNGKGDITASGTAALQFHEVCDWTVNALGATGSIMPGGWAIEQVIALGTIGNPFVIPATAVTADILDQDAVYFVYKQTSGAETTTPPQMQELKIEVVGQ